MPANEKTALYLNVAATTAGRTRWGGCDGNGVAAASEGWRSGLEFAFRFCEQVGGSEESHSTSTGNAAVLAVAGSHSLTVL